MQNIIQCYGIGRICAITDMKQRKVKEEGEHEVTLALTIAKASTTDREYYKKKSELPQVQNYFHCEYKLLPDDKHTIKTDVVTFGTAAKLYCENDSKVLRTWLDKNKTWVTWTTERKVRVTIDSLLKMFKHKFVLKVWDSKDKVSARARFDRPKAFRLPPTKTVDEIDLDTIRELLLKEGKTNMHLGKGFLMDSRATSTELLYKGASRKVSFLGNESDKDLQQKMSQSTNSFIGNSESKLEVQVKLDENQQPEFKNLITLASTGVKCRTDDVVETKTDNKLIAGRNSSRQKSNSMRGGSPRHTSPMLRKLDSEAQRIQQHGVASLSIPMSALFTNCVSISNNIKESVNSLEEVIVILTLDKPLLSERQRQVLNPMVLTVCAANQMPDDIFSSEELKLRCLPPFVKYKFYQCPEHVSEMTEYRKTIKFNDCNVVLLGTMNKERLFEYLRGPLLKIEIHDRDPKEISQQKSLVFGSQPEDNSIWNNTGLSKDSSSNNDRSIRCGVAEYDLSELLLGERILELVSPIRNHYQNQNSNVQLPSKSLTRFNIPSANYLECGSDLKIKIELARSLLLTDDSLYYSESESRILTSATANTVQCPFNRLVYIFDYNNKKFLGEILTKVSEVNARALNLSTYPQHVIDAALSTYKLTDEEKEDTSLDIITGCQIIDGTYHIFILEGLAKQGLKQIWDQLGHPEYNEQSFFRVLYNSSIAFAQRMYQSLDVDLTRVKLYQPLESIVRQPLLYVRDMVPRLCFEAVTKLFQLTRFTSLHSAVRNDLLPTAEMIVSLGKEFGVPLSENDFHEQSNITVNNETTGTDVPSDTTRLVASFKRHRELVDTKNEMYEKILIERKNEKNAQTDHVCANIKSLLTLSKAKMKQPTLSCEAIQVPHNYSSQTSNSTVMANEKLRDILARDKGARYTYCNKYQSATLVPVSVEKIAKERERLSKENWKTCDGFVFPGVKSSTESNHHSKPIHPARLHELNLPWRENILHANVIKPTVDRLLFKWENRTLDFNTWSPSEPFFGEPAVVTIHKAGDSLKNEQMESKVKDESDWKEKLVVDDVKFKTHRCLPATELTDKGPKASNQHAKLAGILKDEAVKFSLSKTKRVPALSVVSHTNTDAEQLLSGDIHARNVGYNPGEVPGLSWSRDKNTVPIKDYKHEYFENMKGHDFRLVHTDREKKAMKIKPLTTEEKDNNLFCPV